MPLSLVTGLFPVREFLSLRPGFTPPCCGRADLFFSRDEGPRSTAAATLLRRAQARQMCARCEVSAECLDEALAGDERWGIWGGLLPEERKALADLGRVEGSTPEVVPPPPAAA